MSTALENPDAIEEATLSEPVTFVSTANELRLVKKPQRRRQVGETGDFEIVPGEDVKFLHGRFVTSDPQLVEWLEKHTSNGIYFHQMGFGAAGQVSDDTPQLVAEILELSLDGNVDRLADILLAERQTMSRPTVMKACEAAINKIDGGGEVPADPDAAPQT